MSGVAVHWVADDRRLDLAVLPARSAQQKAQRWRLADVSTGSVVMPEEGGDPAHCPERLRSDQLTFCAPDFSPGRYTLTWFRPLRLDT